MTALLRLALTAAFSFLAVLAGGTVLNRDAIWLDTADHVSPGAVTVSLAAPESADRMTFDAPALAPGDTAATPIDLVTSLSSGKASTATLTTIATSSSLLDQDPVNGLRLTIDRCSVPWEALPAAIRVSYRCSGDRVSVVASRPVRASNVPLSNLDAGDGPAKQHLLFSLTLPATAGNEFQGLSSTIEYVFTAP